MEDKKPSILVVDDEPEIVQALTHFLAVKGYDVTGACDGEQALAALERKRADLVLLDIMMPRLDGKDAARIIKQRYPATKLVVVTGYPGEGEGLYKENLLEAFFIKPVQLHELYNKLTLILHQEESPQPELSEKIKARVLMLKAKVLFVEPSPEIYGFLSSHFKPLSFLGQDYSFDVVSNEKEAVRKIMTFKPNIIVFDKAYFSKLDPDITKGIEQLINCQAEIISYDLCGALQDHSELEKFVKTLQNICLKNGFLEIRWVEI